MTCFVTTLTISSQELADNFWSHFPPSSLHVELLRNGRSANENYICDFRDEAADTGDQLDMPIDRARQMSFHECKNFSI
jgi:hypothetical protein